MSERVVVTVTFKVTLGVDSSARLEPALHYVLNEFESRLEAMRGETKMVSAYAKFEPSDDV